jgi:hypothetical protein
VVSREYRTDLIPEYYRAEYIRRLRRLGTVEAQAGTSDPAQAAAWVRSLADAMERGTELSGKRPALHFVGFRDPEQFQRAERVFGAPDFVHRVWDVRAARGGEIAPGDTVVFARGTVDDPPSPYAYDDSAYA